MLDVRSSTTVGRGLNFEHVEVMSTGITCDEQMAARIELQMTDRLRMSMKMSNDPRLLFIVDGRLERRATCASRQHAGVDLRRRI